jgi:hypothetical protein
VQALAARFPGTPRLVGELEKQLKGLDFDQDVKPALGPEVDIVVLDPAGKDVVGLTKPDTTAKLKLLLRSTVSPGETKPAITPTTRRSSTVSRLLPTTASSLTTKISRTPSRSSIPTRRRVGG